MFKQTLLSKARRNRVIIDYAQSTNLTYRHKKKLRLFSVIKWCLFICAVATACFYVMPLNATTYNKYSTLDEVTSGQLLFESTETLKGSHTEKKLYESAITLNSDASFDIDGIIATVTVTQSFLNKGNTITNGLYTFPLPENSAVNYLKVQVGNREIEGKILEKNTAKKLFKQAKLTGKKASLVEQHRPNIFTNKIANIKPNEQITVTIKYIQRVDYTKDKFSLRFPMNITPRYLPNQVKDPETVVQNSIEQSDKFNMDLNIARLTQFNKHAKNNISLNVKLNAGFELVNIHSPSHILHFDKTNLNNKELGNKGVQIKVGNVEVPMNKDFILQWFPKPSSNPQLSLYSQKLEGEYYTLAMLLPPILTSDTQEQQITLDRDITFIIDTSGSMQGKSIKQAKKSLRFALNTLTPKDSFNIIAFSSQATPLFNTTRMATTENIKQALYFINQLSANGGTEMYQPLSQALTMPKTLKQDEDAVQQILFITDGAVSNELALFKLIKNANNLPRLFTVGIGNAPNGFFMRKAAQFGQGSYTLIGNLNEVEKNMSELLEKISRPALTNINVRFYPLHVGNIEQYPKKIPDLYTNEPLIITFKTSEKPLSIQLFGDLATESWQQNITLNTNNEQSNSSISSLWARAKIEDLLDGLVLGQQPSLVKSSVIKTSLKHQVMSPYTSFIAIEKELKTDEDDKDQNETLLTKKNLKNKGINNKVINNQALQAAAFPKTAIGWKFQLIIGMILFALSYSVLLTRRKKVSHEAV